jgi:hypothetical protein
MLRFKKYKLINKLTDEEFIELVEQLEKLEHKIFQYGSDEQRRKYYEKDYQEKNSKVVKPKLSRRRNTSRKNQKR